MQIVLINFRKGLILPWKKISMRVVKIVDMKFIKRNLLALIVGIVVYFLAGVLLNMQFDIYDVLMFIAFFVIVLNIVEILSSPKEKEA